MPGCRRGAATSGQLVPRLGLASDSTTAVSVILLFIITGFPSYVYGLVAVDIAAHQILAETVAGSYCSRMWSHHQYV